MSKKIKIASICLISFAIGILVGAQFDNLFGKKIIGIDTQKRSFLKEKAQVPSSQVKIFSEKKSDLTSVALQKITPGPIVKDIDFIQLSSQLRAFQKRISDEVDKKFETVYVEDFKKKIHNSKREHVQAIFNNLFEEKKFWFKASIKNEQDNSQLVFYFSFVSCSLDFKKPPGKTNISDACYYLRYYSFINNKWSDSGVGGSYGPGEWHEDRPYLSLFTEYLEGYIKATNALRLLVPIPTASGQLLLLKYKNGKFSWEGSDEIVWKATTENEINNFEKYVMNYNREHEENEEQ